VQSDPTGDNVAASLLRTQIKSGVTSCTNAGFAGTGTLLSGSTAVTPSTTLANFVGNPAAGAQTGDRTLASGASETLCLQISFPHPSATAYSGHSSNLTYTFAAEQTVNNP
jgi:hypothetical protein